MNFIKHIGRSRQFLALLLLFLSMGVYAQNRNNRQTETISLETISEIISSSIFNKGLETRVRQIDIYILLDSCIYHYNRQNKTLESFLKGNYKEELGNKDMLMGIIYVAHNITSKKNHNATYLYGCEISNNILRKLEKDNLTIISRVKVNRDQLGDLLGLSKNESIIISQTLGYL